jgi:tetratricopeptide (TPR) repeat protein
MKTNILVLKLNICLFVLIFVYSPNIYAQTLTAEQIYKKVTNAVVVIHAYDYSNELVKQGSGVVLNDKGYVVTNYHVLAGCDRLEILHNKEIIPYVDIIGIDVEKDILILKIEAKKFPAIKIGNSKKLNIGQRIYAIGSPLGYENTISEGIISGLRSYEESEKNFIQITASISAGSSGGAIVNDKGELIGISTLTAKEGQNLNFAIPIDAVLGVRISSYSKNDAYKDFELFDKGLDAGRKGNHYEAIKYFSLYIDKFPNDAVAYYNRGITRAKLEDYPGAIQDYNKAIEINLNDADAYYCRGNAQAKLGNFRGAIQDYNKAIEINTIYAIAYNNRGAIKIELKDYIGAIQDINKAIEINPNYAEAYNNRGITKAKLEDYMGVIQDLNKAIEINPNYADAYYNRGLAKYKLRDKNGACLDWSKAGELGNKNAYKSITKHCN